MHLLLFHLSFPARAIPVAFEHKPALQQEIWIEDKFS